MCNTRKARIAYTGESLDDGSMPVRELAPALLSFAELVERSYKVIGGEQKIKVLLNQDSLKRGSFDITFILNLDVLEQIRLFVSSAKESGLDDLLTVLGWIDSTAGVATLVSGGVFGLIKCIRGRGIKKVTDNGNKTADLLLSDDTKLTVHIDTLKVFFDAECRKSIERIIRPVMEENADGFQLRNPGDITDKHPIVNISQREAILYKTPPPSEPDESINNVTEKQKMIAHIISVNFNNGKWRLSDGTNAFWATIVDDEFLQKVENGDIAFAKGDNLQIEYYLEQTVKSGKLSTTYIITKVLTTLRNPKQTKLNLE